MMADLRVSKVLLKHFGHRTRSHNHKGICNGCHKLGQCPNPKCNLSSTALPRGKKWLSCMLSIRLDSCMVKSLR